MTKTMEKHVSSLYSTAEDCSMPFSPTPANFNEDNIPHEEMLFVQVHAWGEVPDGGSDSDGALQGHQQDLSDRSEW